MVGNNPGPISQFVLLPFPELMNKSQLVQLLKQQLQDQYERTIQALEGATEAATGDDTKAESKYDTRGLEASYLAAGQAGQADELAEAIALLETAEFPELDFEDPVQPGALVEVDQEGNSNWYLLAPAGGGLTLEPGEGEPVTVLGPSAPLRTALLGKAAGDSLDHPRLTVLEVM